MTPQEMRTTLFTIIIINQTTPESLRLATFYDLLLSLHLLLSNKSYYVLVPIRDDDEGHDGDHASKCRLLIRRGVSQGSRAFRVLGFQGFRAFVIICLRLYI
jgi:hypothetical protein